MVNRSWSMIILKTCTTYNLTFYDQDIPKLAKCNHLCILYKLKNYNLVRMSDLNKVFITCKPIERQKLST